MKRTLKQIRADMSKLSDGLLTAQAAAERLRDDVDMMQQHHPNMASLLLGYSEILDAMQHDLSLMSCQAISIYSQLGYFNLSIAFNMVSDSTVSTELSTSILSGEGGEHGQNNDY